MITIPAENMRQIMHEVINDFLIPKFVALGMNATGEWIESLEARVTDNTGEIWGRDYTYYLAKGRAPGNRPPITPLVKWVGAKFGLSGQEAVGAAFAIATKIEKEGTEYYPSGTDLLEVLNSYEVKQFVYDRAAQEMNTQVQLKIQRNLQEVFA